MKIKMPVSTLIRLCILLLICLSLPLMQAAAQGRMVIKPMIEAEWQRDSNFHKSETDEKSVDTYLIRPGLEFGYTTDKSKIVLDYSLNNYRYDDRDDIAAGELKADEYDYTGHRADLGAETNPTDRITIGIDNLFWKTRDPANADADSNAVDRYKYTMNELSPWLNYRFGEKFSVRFGYTNKLLDYSDDDPGEGEDSIENRGSATLNYNLNRKSSFDLDLQYWTRDYDKDTIDYDSFQSMVNFNHKFNYFTLSAGAGFHKREFDEQVTGGDIEQPAWQISLYGQNPPENVEIPKSSLYVRFGSNLNDIGTADSYYQSTRLDVRGSYLLFERVNCSVSGWFQNSDYETSDREDDRWFASGSVDYLINEYFTVGLEAGYEERDSSEDGLDFDNQYLMLAAEFKYDMGSR